MAQHNKAVINIIRSPFFEMAFQTNITKKMEYQYLFSLIKGIQTVFGA